MGEDDDHACPVDGCDFTSSSKRGVKAHCGRTHSDKNNPLAIECECNHCGDEFTIPKSHYERGDGQYCSRECKCEGKKNRVECECNHCGDEFTIRKARYENGGGKYCSNECRSKDRNVECECNHCGEEFTIRKSDYERGGGKYCSRECHGLDQRQSNPDLRKSPEYIEWRKNVFDRDGHECQDCGAEDDLHAHHITPISEDESRATDVDNGVTLCVACHASRHRQRGDERVAKLLHPTKGLTMPFEVSNNEVGETAQ